MIASGIVASVTAGSTRCQSASAEASNSRVSSPSRTKNPVTSVLSMPVLIRPDGGKKWMPWVSQSLSR